MTIPNDFDSLPVVTMTNISILNLRMAFQHHLFLFRQDDFRAQFGSVHQTIRMPYCLWNGLACNLLNLILREAIIGIEAYVSSAVWIEAGKRGILTDELEAKTHNPFSLGGKSAPDNFFNRLPALIDPQFSMKNCNISLWEKTALFYRTVRNPLFHGREINPVDPQQVLSLFEFLRNIYEWIDSWHNIELVWPGASNLTKY